MRRWILPFGAVLFLVLGVWLSRGGADTWTGEAGGPVRITGYGGQLVHVTHAGALRSVLTDDGGTSVTVTGTALDVNCTGCSAASVVAVTHISAALHIGGGQVRIVGRDPNNQAVVVTHTGELNVNCVTGCSAGSSDTVNVFHQSTVRHISSLTHVVVVDWQRWFHSAVAQSGSWTVQAAHQGGNWAIGHISSVTHVRGLVGIQDDTCPTCKARVDHYNALANQPHISGALRAWQAATCGTTARQVVATNANRRDLIVRNIGLPNSPANAHTVWIGYGTTGHVALTVLNGFPLHAMIMFQTRTEGLAAPAAITVLNGGENSNLRLENYSGPLSCVSQGSGGNLSLIEVLR